MNSDFLKFISKPLATLTLIGLVLTGAVPAVAQVQPVAQEPSRNAAFDDRNYQGTVAEPQGKSYVQGQKFNPKWSRVTLYRPAQGFSTGVASISINGHFHTALQLGGYSEICVEAGNYELTAHMVQTGAELKNSKDDTATLKPQIAQDLYVRVFEYGDGRATLTPVRDDVAIPELKEVRRQAHAVSRFTQTKPCYESSSETPGQPEKITKENISFGADALFDFDRSDIDGMTPQGRESLRELVARLQKLYPNQKSPLLHITGHADPLGSPLFNQRLSEARAMTVRRFMNEAGLNTQQTTIEGKGANQPVVSTCSKTATAESIQCNKPNRRVVVMVQELAR
jgi:outer membrane protein OmpA-like peptidoglycan-associated protein